MQISIKSIYLFFCLSSLLTVASEQQSKKLTIAQTIALGGAAGIAEVTVNSPLCYFANRIAQQLPIEWNPKVWWRGYPANAASMMPITALQVTAQNKLQHMVVPNNQQPTAAQKVGTASAAGLMSGLVSGPAEVITMYQQNNKGTSLSQAFRKAPIRSGLFGTMLRDGGFTAGFLAGMPLADDWFKKRGANDQVATVSAGLLVGPVTSLATQACATSKTVAQQAAMHNGFLKDHQGNFIKNSTGAPVRIHNEWQAACHLYQTGGIKELHRGGMPRALRIALAIPLMDKVKTALIDKI